MSSYIALESQTLGSAASSVTFSNIPTTKNGKTLRDLVLVINGTLSANTACWLVFNSDTTSANYSMVYMAGNGSSTFSGTDTVGAWINYRNITANDPAIWSAQIMDFAQSKHKSVLARSNASGSVTEALASRWASTSTITTILARPNSGNWNSGTTFSLYGIEG